MNIAVAHGKARTWMNWQYSDLVAVLLTTTFCVIPTVSAVRVVMGTLMVSFVPGYALSLCIFPKREQLSDIERWGLALIVTTCLDMFIPFILSETGWGVSSASFSDVLGSILVILLLVAAVRRRNLRTGDAYFPYFLITRTCAAMLVATVGIAGVVTFIVKYNAQLPVSFFVTNTIGIMRHYPFNVRMGDQLAVGLHISNPTTRSVHGEVFARDVTHGTFYKKMVIVQAHSNLSLLCQLPTTTPNVTEKVRFEFHSKAIGESRDLWISYNVITQ